MWEVVNTQLVEIKHVTVYYFAMCQFDSSESTLRRVVTKSALKHVELCVTGDLPKRLWAGKRLATLYVLSSTAAPAVSDHLSLTFFWAGAARTIGVINVLQMLTHQSTFSKR